MSQSRALLVVVALAFLLALPAGAAARNGAPSSAGAGLLNESEPPAPDLGAPFAPDRVVVRWNDPGRAVALERDRGLERLQTMALPGAAVVATGGRPVAELVAELNADPTVAFAEPDYIISVPDDMPVDAALTVEEEPVGETAVLTNDPRATDQYSLDRMRVRDAWSLSTGGNGLIAVLDTGVWFAHPELNGRVVSGWDFANDDSSASDDNGHGTWVTGIIVARANDGFGMAGISWSDKVVPVKVMNQYGTGYTSWLASGIRWAADRGATVINMSVGGFPYATALVEAIDYAWSKGAVLVGASGNNGIEQTFYPASYNHVISVSATQMDDEFTHWSSFGSGVDVSAPGGSVLTTNCDRDEMPACPYYGDHIVISGTSFAAPNVSGVLALIRAKYPTASNQWIVDRLIGTVDDLGYAGYDKRYGHGRVNAYRALGGVVARPALASGDALESNNTLASARVIALGTTINPSIHPAGDVDFFAIDVPRAGRLDVRVTPVVDKLRLPKSSLPIDPVVELYTTAGVRLVRVDSADPAAIEVASTTVSGPTRIIVRISNYYPNGNPVAYSVTPTYVDTVPPKVVGRYPAAGALNVNRFVRPTATFDEPVKGVSASSVRLRDSVTGALVPATVSYDAVLRQARIAPGAQLEPTRLYVVEVTSGVTDAFSNPMVATSWSFTTGLYGFSDIEGSQFEADIVWLFESGITAGCSVDRFCPTASVTREQMASFLARAMNLPPTSTDFFVDDETSMHEDNINRVAAAGITTGCSASRFCPTAVVSRDQMASFLARALGLPATATDFFVDDQTNTHQANINRLAAAGITTGCSADRYCPSAPVSREQMAAFLHRAFGR